MKTNCNVETISIGSIRYYRGYMPIAILVNDEGAEVGYLSPFRGYSFQVSATFDGHSDLGSTQVFGLNNMLDARLGTERNLGYQSNLRMDSVKLYMLELAAKEAINKFCSTTWQLTKEYGVETIRIFNDEKTATPYLGDGRELPFLFGGTMLQRFVALCCKWLAPELYATYTSEADMEDGAAKSIDYHEKELVSPRCDEKTAAYHRRAIEEIKADIAKLKEMNSTIGTAKEVG